MPDDPTTPSNGATPTEEAPRSLREIAEEAWDTVVEDAPADDGEPASGQDGPPRDSLGRFVKSGEAEHRDAPSPEDGSPEQAPSEAKPVQPAPEPTPGSSIEPPQHWSAEHREMFAKLDPAGQRFLLDRHSDMERDYQQKAQASATAVQFTNALAPIFQDPVIAGSLQQAGVSPFHAIEQWGGWHKRAMDPNPAVRLALWQELGQRMGLDPAAAGQTSQPGPGQLSEADLKDPAIKYFADHVGRTANDMQALRAQLDAMQKQDVERQQAVATRNARWHIDQFADEKDTQGNLKRPYFDKALPAIIEMYRLDPNLDIAQAYEEACWRIPEVRQAMLAAGQQQARQQQSNERARQAVRSNVRGVTSPVSKPEQQTNGSRSLRETLEASADEVGF